MFVKKNNKCFYFFRASALEKQKTVTETETVGQEFSFPFPCFSPLILTEYHQINFLKKSITSLGFSIFILALVSPLPTLNVYA
jgi:hypothetical protein